jgi:D-lyxose ketol-isomerase
MKRSKVNEIMREADAFIRSFGFILPPFAYWSPAEMRARRAEIGGIVDARLGWDITDYGQGRFDKMGLFLFTVRNGSEADLRRGGGMCYAEKIMISRQDQVSPMHRHVVKAEDIINRGGATLALKLYESDAAGHIDHRAEAEPRGERDADAGQLARLLGRGRRRADRRGLDGEQRPDRQHLRRTDRAVLRNRGGRGAVAPPGVGLSEMAGVRE